MDTEKRSEYDPLSLSGAIFFRLAPSHHLIVATTLAG